MIWLWAIASKEVSNRVPMPALHRYLGNPVLTGIGRLFFHSPCGDFHCGLRGFSKEAIERLDLRTTGMEFASETVVKATLHKFELPKCLRHFQLMVVTDDHICAVGGTVGDTSDSYFFTALAGCFFIRDYF